MNTKLHWIVGVVAAAVWALPGAGARGASDATNTAAGGISGLAARLTEKMQTLSPEKLMPGQGAEIKVENLGKVSTGTGQTIRITLNVTHGEIGQVLNAFARQTGRNVVVGPEVIGEVNARISNATWDAALEALLKPYGYGFQMVGESIVVDKAERIAAAAAAVPVETRVFQLKFLDASDVEDLVKAQLTERGKVTVVKSQGQFWEPSSSGGGGGGGQSQSGDSNLSRGRRTKEVADIVRSKRLVVRDITPVLENVQALLTEIDVMPPQVMIEARFVEVTSDLLRDIGLELSGAETYTDGKNLFRAGGDLQTGIKPKVFPGDTAIASAKPFNSGGTIFFQQLTELQFAAMLHLVEEDSRANILSSPRILTMNNQEARIIVGEKFPIIQYEQDVTDAGVRITAGTSLDYYERIGIQLAVVPQICDGEHISMIVYPSVTDRQSLVETYPILSTREAETQIMLKSGQTIVIGGLVRDRERKGVLGVPFLRDIPILGRLFRRDVTSNDKVDLLIFLTASIYKTPTAELAPEAKEGTLRPEAAAIRDQLHPPTPGRKAP